jgi:glutamate:GABA antiporter
MALYEKNLPSTSEKQGNLPTDGGLLSERQVPETMPCILNTWDMTTTFVVSIYLATCATTAASAGPAALTYLLLVGAIFFLPSLIATLQLGVMFPFEGALYNWTHKALGGHWAFFSGFCAWFPGVLISASVADLFISYLQAMYPGWLATSWQMGLAISIILVLAGLISIQRFRTVQNLINILIGLMFIGSLLVGISAFVWLMTGHHSAVNFAQWSAWRMTPQNLSLFGLTSLAYIGTEAPLNMAGETIGSHVVKRHLILGAVLIGITYLLTTVSILIVQGPAVAGDPFALVTTANMALGKPFGSIVAVCSLASFSATILAYNYIYARLLLVGSIDRHLPKALGKLNTQRVPANAILFQTALSILFTIIIFVLAPLTLPFQDQMNFSLIIYHISQAAASLVWTVSAAFLFINLMVYSILHPQNFHRHRIFPMSILWICIGLGLLSSCYTIIDTLLFSWASQVNDGQWWYIVGGLTSIFLIIAGIGSIIANSEAYWQDFKER